MSTHAAHVAAALDRLDGEAGPSVPPPSAPSSVHLPGSDTVEMQVAHLLLAGAIAVQQAGKGLRARARIRHDGIAIQILTLVETLLDMHSDMTPEDFAGSAALALANAQPIVASRNPALAQRLDVLRRTLSAATRSRSGGS